MTARNVVLEPPDGGWAWVVCFAFALGNFIYVPILQNFGLIFKNSFPQFGINATEGSIIINLNASFGMMMGLINGSLLVRYGYRKVAVAGALIISIGLIFTAFADSFASFIFTYGLITSIGFGLTASSLSLAFNSYFKAKRTLAMGYAMAATGIGPIIMPLFVSYLLQEYDIRGTVLILGALTFNSLVAATLLQPVKWHVKKKCPLRSVNGESALDESSAVLLATDQPGEPRAPQTKRDALAATGACRNRIGVSSLSINHDNEAQSIYGFETPLPIRKTSTASNYESDGRPHYRRSASHQKSVSAMSSISSLYCSAENDLHKSTAIVEDEHEEEEAADTKKSNVCGELLKKVITLFDLTLLKDPLYLNLMFGMSIAICAEINFGLFTPFILDDMHFTTFEIAQIMSLIAATDIFFRLCAPFVAKKLQFTERIMYLCSLFLLISTRTGLLFANTFTDALVVAFFLGLAKGFRTVFMQLLIPSYVPLERLAAASGLQMVVNGVVIMINGPIIGKIRDLSGNYRNSIIVINCLTFSTILMWTAEILYRRFKIRNRTDGPDAAAVGV